MEKINKDDWKYYLTRPFNLFEASIWHEWYCSDLMYELVGIKLMHGLYVEYPAGNARSYRRPAEIDLFMKLASDTAQDINKAMNILNEAIEINKEAERVLSKEVVLGFEEALIFLNKLVIYAILPYYIGNFRFSDPEISSIVSELRSVSYYPKIFKEIVIPMSVEKLFSLGFKNKEILNVSTITELLSGQINAERLSLKTDKNYYVYQNNNGVETISWTDNPGEIVDEIEGDNLNGITEISGTVASKGFVTGRVRIIQSNDISKVIFNKGDILVSASTNPSLISIIQKAGAILTDEGGLMSHASILSRELNIPCIIATKNATRFFKDGDVVEVDANRGIVKRLN